MLSDRSFDYVTNDIDSIPDNATPNEILILSTKKNDSIIDDGDGNEEIMVELNGSESSNHDVSLPTLDTTIANVTNVTNDTNDTNDTTSTNNNGSINSTSIADTDTDNSSDQVSTAQALVVTNQNTSNNSTTLSSNLITVKALSPE